MVGIGARALPILRRIVIESLPILALAGVVDLLAGITIQKRFESFLTFPALLVLVPAFLEDSGSLGAILAARVSTKLHLGTLGEGGASWRAAIDDVMLVYVYAIPVFVFLGLSSTVVANVAEQGEPGRRRHAGREPDRRFLRDDGRRWSWASTRRSRPTGSASTRTITAFPSSRRASTSSARCRLSWPS